MRRAELSERTEALFLLLPAPMAQGWRTSTQTRDAPSPPLTVYGLYQELMQLPVCSPIRARSGHLMHCTDPYLPADVMQPLWHLRLTLVPRFRPVASHYAASDPRPRSPRTSLRSLLVARCSRLPAMLTTSARY